MYHETIIIDSIRTALTIGGSDDWREYYKVIRTTDELQHEITLSLCAIDQRAKEDGTTHGLPVFIGARVREKYDTECKRIARLLINKMTEGL